ncbi:PadR family transcriptional regulator [Mariniluteicoccus flavus]
MSLRYAALGLLAQRPGSGYDLLKRFEQSMGNVWSATQSQLYTELNSLSAEELIAVTSVGPRGRKEYAIFEQTVAMAEEALVTLERLRADIKWSDNDSDRFGRISLEWGIRSATMERDWAQWALGQIPGDTTV